MCKRPAVSWYLEGKIQELGVLKTPENDREQRSYPQVSKHILDWWCSFDMGWGLNSDWFPGFYIPIVSIPY